MIYRRFSSLSPSRRIARAKPRSIARQSHKYRKRAIGPPYNPTHSLSMDGTRDYMDITPVDLGTECTISYWHKKPVNEVYPGALEIPIGNTNYGGGGYVIYSVPDPSNGAAYIRVGAQTVAFALGSTLFDAILKKSWGHIVIVRTEETKFKLYINGAEVDSEKTNASLSGGLVVDRIGAGGAGGASYDIAGLMTDVAFFDAALSAATISTMYNNGVPTDLKRNDAG